MNDGTLAKLTVPKISGVVPRERLMTALDRCRRRPVVWISGPPGVGKTTMVASYVESRKLPCLWYKIDEGDGDLAGFFYFLGLAAKKASPRYKKPLPLLTSEYFFGIPAFTRRYFEELFRRLRPPAVVVFDNYQDAAPFSGINTMIPHALDTVPSGVTVFVISRMEPSSAVARLRASDTICAVGDDDIRFTLEETKALIANRCGMRPPARVVRQLHAMTSGWAAGLVLITGQGKSGLRVPDPSDGKPLQEVFDYFTGEVFNKLDVETRDFLLMASFLPRMTARTAAQLTGFENAGSVLSQLSHNHFFTQKHLGPEAEYEFHPLFRHFLINRMTECTTPEGIRCIKKQAAVLLAESDRAEDAACLLIDAREWDELFWLIRANAQTLIAQGRILTLEGWLTSFPDAYLSRHPWLSYWLGVCRLPFDPVESMVHFERAFGLFETEDAQTVEDRSGEFLSWAGIVDAIYFARTDFTPLARWADVMEKRLRQDPRFPSREIEIVVAKSMFGALLFGRPIHEKLAPWERRLLALLPAIRDNTTRVMTGALLLQYYFRVDELANATRLIHELKTAVEASDVSTIAYLWWRANEATHHYALGNFEKGRSIICHSLKTAKSAGVHLLDAFLLSLGCQGALYAGDQAAAADFLERMKPLISPARSIDAVPYHHMSAWLAVLRDDPESALDREQSALFLAASGGAVFFESLSRMAVAQICIALGNYPEARKNIAASRRTGRAMKSALIEYQCLLAEAQLHLKQCDAPSGLRILRSALTMAKSRGTAHHPLWMPAVMANLCASALEAEMDVEYVRDLIRTWGLHAPSSATAGERWPWPIRIYTLGGFELIRNDETVHVPGKPQQKPLALLKTLIAYGGKDVAEDQFIDVLWPDAEGDRAHKSFEMTVLRLRKLIGHESLEVHERRLSLDRNRCWVDVWALEAMMQQTEIAWKTDGRSPGVPAEAVRRWEKTFAIYRGHFLPGDSLLSCVLTSRERLRSKFLRFVNRMGEHCEELRQWKEAAEVYQKGLEVDDLSEGLYRRLMTCYRKLGQRAEAVTLYNRCREHLSSAVGIAPSTETEAVYRSVIE